MRIMATKKTPVKRKAPVKKPVARKATTRKSPVKTGFLIYSSKFNEFFVDVVQGKVEFGTESQAVIFPSQKLAHAFTDLLESFPNGSKIGLKVIKK